MMCLTQLHDGTMIGKRGTQTYVDVFEGNNVFVRMAYVDPQGANQGFDCTGTRTVKSGNSVSCFASSHVNRMLYALCPRNRRVVRILSSTQR